MKKHKTLVICMQWALAVVLGSIGVGLLIGEKTLAGASVVGSAVIMVLPLGRLIKNTRALQWTRSIAIVILCAVAAVSIAGTDIPPTHKTSGYLFIDKIMVIAQDVQDKLAGEGGSTQNTPTNEAATPSKEAAFSFTECMREQGITDFPDPTFIDGAPSFQKTSELKSSREAVQQARNSCEHILTKSR